MSYNPNGGDALKLFQNEKIDWFMCERFWFVYIKSHVTLHARSKA